MFTFLLYGHMQVRLNVESFIFGKCLVISVIFKVLYTGLHNLAENFYRDHFVIYGDTTFSFYK